MPDIRNLPKGAQFTGLAIGNADLSTGAVIGTKISTNAVINTKITDGCIANAKLSSPKAYFTLHGQFVIATSTGLASTTLQYIPVPYTATLVKLQGIALNPVHSSWVVVSKNAAASIAGRIGTNASWGKATKSAALSKTSFAAGDMLLLGATTKNSAGVSCSIDYFNMVATFKVAHTP